jgi:hypothetical protein
MTNSLASGVIYCTLMCSGYYNTSTGLMVYTGSVWSQVSSNVTISEIDAGAFDSIAPYNGGDPITSATQSFEGGTP